MELSFRPGACATKFDVEVPRVRRRRRCRPPARNGAPVLARDEPPPLDGEGSRKTPRSPRSPWARRSPARRASVLTASVPRQRQDSSVGLSHSRHRQAALAHRHAVVVQPERQVACPKERHTSLSQFRTIACTSSTRMVATGRSPIRQPPRPATGSATSHGRPQAPTRRRAQLCPGAPWPS